MNNITIRPATISDYDAIYPFVCGLEERIFDKEELRACYIQCLAQSNHHYLMAVMGEQPVGYISCHGQVLMHHSGMVYEIQELYVLPEHRSKGIGKVLLEALEKLLATEDYKILELASNVKRIEAHRFYLNNGYEKTSFKFKKSEWR